MRALGSRISAGLAAPSWDIPTLVLTGDADKFIKVCGVDILPPASLLDAQHVMNLSETGP
jgi:hypothetical protein